MFSPLTCLDTGHPDYFKINKNYRRSKRSWKSSQEVLDPIVSSWIHPRKKIPATQTTLFVVLSSSKVDSSKSYRNVQPKQNDKFFIPFLCSAMDKGTPFVKFHCLSGDDLKSLKKLALSGIVCGEDGQLFDDFVSSHFSSHRVELLCVDDIPCTTNKDYHYSSKVFGGESSLDMIDDSFIRIPLAGGEFTAHYKFADSTQFLQHVPLSAAFFDSNFHKFKLSLHHARIFIGKVIPNDDIHITIHFVLICFIVC